MNKQQYQLIFERYPIKNTPALEIGASRNPWLEGSRINYMDKEIGIYHELFGSDAIKHDLEDLPLPFNDHQFAIVAMREVLEHVCPKKQIPVMNEIHRILQPGGILMLTVPYYRWHGAHSTPDHCKYFTEDSFRHYHDGTYNGASKWTVDTLVKVRESDQLRHMKIISPGQRLSSPKIRRIMYWVLSYAPWKRYTRNLFVRLQKC